MAAIGDLAEVVVKWGGFPGLVLSVYGFKAKATSGTLVNLATAFQAAVVKNTGGGLLYAQQSIYTISELEVSDIVPGTAATYLHSFPAVAGASGTGEALPPQCAMVLSFSTALAGRSFRGRSYWPGLGEAQQNNGTWIAAALSAGNSLITQLLAVFGAAGTDTNWQMVVISRVTNGVARPTPIGTAIVSGSARPTVYTQRRRVAGFGG